MYIPHENSNVKSIRLSRRTAIGLSTIGVGLGTLLAGLVVFAVTGGAGSADAAVENDQLRTELATMEGQVATLGQKLESLLGREEELRLVADLPPVPVEVQAVGIGGPGHSFFLADGESEAPGEPAIKETLEETSTTIDMLLRRSELVASSMNEVRKSIATKKARFEATPSIWPTSGFLSSTFSLHRSHPIFHDVRPHYGIDISSRRGNPIVATAAGKVIRSGWESGHGNLVVIDHGGGLRTAYSHASRVLVKADQNVERGDTIALVGSTGFSVAPHVHYEVHENGQPVDPLKYIFPDAIAD
jgi:murein DD-endopeptidase MepM/ murein hydrolase activator NlpD